MNCGCRIVEHGTFGVNLERRIEFCPLHAAAEELAEAVHLALQEFELVPPDEGTEAVCRQFEAALEHAQRRDP